MTDAYIIETKTVTAGIVAAHGRGFRFYASHPTMFALEGRVFESPKAAQAAAEKLIDAALPVRSTPSDDVSRWGYPAHALMDA